MILGATVLSFFRPNPVLVSIRRLTALPLVFAACVSFVFCVSKFPLLAWSSTAGLLIWPGAMPRHC